MKNSTSQIKFGAVMSYVILFFNIVLGLIYTPWILRTIGKSDYGLYTLATSLISMLLLDFGMSAAVSRYVSLYRAEKDKEKINNFLGIVSKIYILITGVLIVVLIVFYFYMGILYKNLTGSEMERFKNVYILVGFTLVFGFPFNTLNGILNAFEEFIVVKGLEMATKLGTVVLTIVVLLGGGGLYALVTVNAVVTVVMVFAKLFFVRKCTGVSVHFHYYNRMLLREIFGFSIWSTIQSIGQSFIYNIVPSILAIVSNTTIITMFGFANVIEGYIASICGAIDGLFLPRVSQIIVREEKNDAVMPLMIQVGRISQSVIQLLLIGLLIHGKEFIDLWLGKEYEAVYYSILILGASYLISTSQQIGNNLIMAKNLIRPQAIITLISGGTSVILIYLFAAKYGIVGVSISILVIQLIRIIGNNIIFIKILKLDIKHFFIECQIKLLPGFLVSTIVAVAVNMGWDCVSFSEGWITLFVKCLLTVFIYVCVCWKISWNEEEKTLIRSFLHYKR